MVIKLSFGQLTLMGFLKSLHVALRRPERMETRHALYRRLSKAAEGFITKLIDTY